MNTNHSLALLKTGESGYITGVRAEPAMARRLFDLGMIKGTRVTCMGKSPAGDPAAYLVRGAVLALRKSDARRIGLETAPCAESTQ